MIQQFVEGGGSVFVIPDSAAQGLDALYPALSLAAPRGWIQEEGQVSEVRWTHPLYRGVFRAVPSRVDWPEYDRILDRTPHAKEEVLIEANNGTAYLSQVRGTSGSGHVYLLGTNLETGNLTRHSLFVPTLLRTAESARQTEGRRYLLGRDQAMTLALQDASAASRETDVDWSVVQVHKPSGQPDVRVVPEVRTTPDGLRLGWGSALTEPGAYAAQKNGITVAVFGLNPSASESQLTCWLPEEWTQELISLGWEDIPVWTKPADQVARMVEQHIAGERLAWYFFLAAIVALALETLLLKRWNKLFS